MKKAHKTNELIVLYTQGKETWKNLHKIVSCEPVLNK